MTIAMRGGQVPHVENPNPNEMAPQQQPQQQPPQPPQEEVLGDHLNQPQPEDYEEDLPEGMEPDFPHNELALLDEMISSPRWVVPVLPKGQLEVLLEASIDLCKKGLDTRSEACQRFFRESLTISFTKILTDEAVNSWKFEIHRCILKNCEKLVELCVVKLDQDWFPLLDLLAMVFNPNNKFHTFNGTKSSETVPAGSQLADEELFARPPDSRTPKGWLVDLINRFGSLGGFQITLDRFQSGKSLSVPVIYSLLRPFGQSCDLLTVHTIVKYFMPIVEIVPSVLDTLTDDELKKEAKNETKNDAISAIIKVLKSLLYRIPDQEDRIKSLEMFRLKMILRLLQISSFNGKMNALNEINKVIASVSYYPHRHSGLEEEEWLTGERMAEWLKENKVLQIVLRDSLHQPQYVEKLEKIIRFVIKERALALEDLDNIWAAQVGKHEAIVKNVHDLLAKLAWDFSPEQLDHLFECFQASWTNASKKQREKLMELIRRLAEDDKDGLMAHKVLTLFWNLAHSDDVSTEIMDQALSAHAKILDYSCSQNRDVQKTRWLDKCVEELKNDKWVLPALKHIREICCQYAEAPPNVNHPQKSSHSTYRHEMVNRLQNQHSLVVLVANNLTEYVDRIRQQVKENPDLDLNTYLPDGWYDHSQQVQMRLNFLRFLLKDGQLWLCEPQAKQIWQCLTENVVHPLDREACFKWFSKLMGEEPDLDPEINRDFFENNILQLDPTLLTESGMKCFERFFKAVNTKDSKLIPKRKIYLMDDIELTGSDYLWRVVIYSSEDIAIRAIELLKETYTNLGPRLQSNQVEIHEDFVSSCIDRLKASYDTISVIERDKDSVNRLRQEVTRMCRVLKVLHEYISVCDGDFGEDRSMIPLYRAHRGKHLVLVIRFPNQGRQVEDMEMWTHTNETLGALRRQILQRMKATSSNMKLDLFNNGDVIEPSEDGKLISQLHFRDKMVLNAKLCQLNTNMPSSPDSSSDSSTGSPQHPYDGPNVEAENCLPGVLMSLQPSYIQFFFQLADLGCSLQHSVLRDSARALMKLTPPSSHVVDKLRNTFFDHAKLGTESTMPPIETIFFGPSSSEVLYHLEVLYAMLMPAINPLSDKAFDFQCSFFSSGDAPIVFDMLTKNNFLTNADLPTKRSAYLAVLRMCKMFLTVLGQVVIRLSNGSHQLDSGSSLLDVTSRSLIVLRQAMHQIPNTTTECMLRNVATRLTQNLVEHFRAGTNDIEKLRIAIKQAAQGDLPDLSTIKTLIKVAWATSCGNLGLLNTSFDDMWKNKDKMPDMEDIQVCKEALEVLTLAFALNPRALETLVKDKSWHTFIIDMLLLCKSRSIRMASAEQFSLMATRCSNGQQPVQFFITLLFTVLGTTVRENARNSHEYFQLLCRLLNHAAQYNCHLPTAENLLNNEISWLKNIKDNVANTGETQVDDALLEGHLGVTRELIAFLSAEKKYEIGCDESRGVNLIKDTIENFIFPASKLMLQLNRTGELPSDPDVPVCTSPHTLIASFELLVALCIGCIPNLRLVTSMLTDMFYSERDEHLSEWEYLPPVGPRPPRGFVGLKNAGATCYMNSVLQQLYMVESIRAGILGTDGAATDMDEDFSGEERMDHEGNMETNENESNDEKASMEESRKEYNIGILKQVQAIFGHLAYSKLQYYVPRGLWKHFKLQGEPVNLREQQDAVEFFMSLVESVDEALKALGQDQIMSKTLGGSYSDQKICKECPHRYSKEEPFSVISVDIRNHSNLLDSLEQYVKGELLEGADAYHCEKCNKKVVTVKRLCVKKLPPILAIQLKRFEYDYERVCAIKFNDYFEFPRDLDMDPYTVSGLAKIEGEVIDCDYTEGAKEVCTKYHLTGIVVHSGQASGGHYYSYIMQRGSDGLPHWYKFDDGEVTECKMDDDEEIKNQCYGGEYMGEVFDHMMKRMSYRRQKRWWNAYILFYTRADVVESSLEKSLNDLSLKESKSGTIKMPAAIDRSVQRQNVRFMHNRNQFSVEYFQFIRKLASCNVMYSSQPSQEIQPEGEELSMLSAQLVSRFLFHTGFHTKKTLRGPATEWYDILCQHLRVSKQIRNWFAQNMLFHYPHRFCEYLLECPIAEIRSSFVKIIVFLAHISLPDGPYSPAPVILGALHIIEPPITLSDYLLQAVLALLRREVSDHDRHLPQYFSLFFMYSSLGSQERKQLLKLSVPATFMLVALDEGPGPPIKYQYAELGKLYQVICQLVRCCDVSAKTQSSQQGTQPLPNPYVEVSPNEYLMPIQPQVAEILYNKPNFIKKLIEEASSLDETAKFLRFCCWENIEFSQTVLNELLWQVAFTYTHELRPHLELLLHVVTLEDSWQQQRILKALKGVPEERDGLFETIQRNKNHYQKRAYQCIKCMVTLFSNCPVAQQLLLSNSDLKRKWSWAVEWLHEELERRPYAPNTQYGYNNWSPPAQSNETSNGYFLERSHSARITLQKAIELCPEEEVEGEEASEEGDIPQLEETKQQQQSFSGQSQMQGRTMGSSCSGNSFAQSHFPANSLSSTSGTGNRVVYREEKPQQQDRTVRSDNEA